MTNINQRRRLELLQFLHSTAMRACEFSQGSETCARIQQEASRAFHDDLGEPVYSVHPAELSTVQPSARVLAALDRNGGIK